MVQPEKKLLRSGIEIKSLYTAGDIEAFDGDRDLGAPGHYPYTRGIYPLMYRERPWIMNQYAGFGTAAETNARFKFLLARGQSGLNVAFDLPTQHGLDTDDPRAEDEVGRLGVAVDTLRDMEEVFDGIPVDKVRTHFTINSTAAIILAMYMAIAAKQGVPPDKVVGTLQNDPLYEFVARGTWIFPPERAAKLVGDTIEYCITTAHSFNPISVCGAHMREQGATSVQEVAFTFLDALAYVREVTRRGYAVDQFVPRFTFLFCSQENVFEEICKVRAARRLWARLMKDNFGAQDEKAMRFKVTAGVGGKSMTAKEPLNNIARIAWLALAGVLGGTNSMTLACYDEAYAIPTEKSQLVSLRIQRMLAHEMGAADTVDPLAGSYFVEALTNEMEAKIQELMTRVEREYGSIVRAIEKGYIQREIAREAYLYEKKLATGEIVKVGLNAFAQEQEEAFEEEERLHRYDPTTRQRQLAKLWQVKKERDGGQVARALDQVKKAAEGQANLMPYLIAAVQSYATVGEIVSALKEVYGEFHEPPSL